MSRHHVPADKNPLHPSALRLKDLTPGRTIIFFSTLFGVLHTYTVLGYPYARSYGGRHLGIRVPVRSSDGRFVEEHCEFLGVIAYGKGVWADTNFVVDHRKAHLLPAVEQLPYPGDLEFQEEFESDYDWRYSNTSHSEEYDDLGLTFEDLEDHLDESDWDHIEDLNRDVIRRLHDEDPLPGESPYDPEADEQLAMLRRKLSGSID